jgi:hypothetical protein
MHPRYQKSVSPVSGATKFGICPFSAWWLARNSSPTIAPSRRSGSPETAIPIEEMEASLQNTRV